MIVELTPAQETIVDLVAKGCLNKEIAARLSITEATVKAHVAAAIKRTGLKNRVQLAVWHATRDPSSTMPQVNHRARLGLTDLPIAQVQAKASDAESRSLTRVVSASQGR